MERPKNIPAFIKMNEQLLEKQANQQAGGDGSAPTTTTTTAAVTAGTTTLAPTTTTTTKAVNSTTTLAPNASGTTTLAPAGDSTTLAPSGPSPELSDERAQQIALDLLRRQTGNPGLTMEDMLAKLQAPGVLTDEQRTKQEQLREQRTMKAYIDAGKGTMDDFFRLRELKSLKDEDLVRSQFNSRVRALDPKVSDKDLEDMFSEQYYIGDNYDAHETAYGAQRIKNEAEFYRNTELKPLSEVEKQLQLDEDAIRGAQDWKRGAQSYVSQLPKSISVPIGKIGETEVGNFTYNLTDEELREHALLLEDPAAFLHSIRDEKTGKTDIKKLSELFLFKQIGQRAIKAAASEYYSKGVDSVTSVLNNAPNLSGSASQGGQSETEERTKGEKIIQEDASRIMGRQNKVKSI